MDETTAREVMLVRAVDTASPELPVWTAAERAWASRVAAETVGADASADAFVARRAHHALQRLLPRDANAHRAFWRWLQQPLWNPWWLLAAAGFGFLVGVAVDQIGPSQRINLLAPPVWALLAWNAVVLVGLAWQSLREAVARRVGTGGMFSRAMQRLMQQAASMRLPRAVTAAVPSGGPGGTAAWARVWAEFSADWARRSLPLARARAATALHVAAAALALGVLGGLYLRGLVLDYRVGWQSTFLDAAAVHGVLSVLLAPAVALSGLALPDVAALDALRDVPAAVTAGGAAAAWIHLYAWTLLLGALLPRLLLALVSGLRAWRLARHFPLPLDEPYFQQLRRHQRGTRAVVVVVPHLQAPDPAATLGLRELCARVWGESVQLDVQPAVPYGSEDEASARLSAMAPDAVAVIALFDLTATPEADTHGRFVQCLAGAAAPGVPVLVVVDESAFRDRFAATPERLPQRRGAWQVLARELGTLPLIAELRAPDADVGESVLQAALGRPAQVGEHDVARDTR